MTGIMQKSEKKVTFQRNLKNVNVALLIEKYKANGDSAIYFNFLQQMKQNEDSEVLKYWIDQFVKNSKYANKTCDLFLDFLDIPWASSSLSVVKSFHHYVLSLVTEHSSIAALVMEKLVSQLIPRAVPVETSEENLVNPGYIPKEKLIAYTNISNLVASVSLKVPLTQDGVCSVMAKSMPFVKCPTSVHVEYLHNLLLLSQLIPSRRLAFYEIMIQFLLSFDVLIPRCELAEDVSADLLPLDPPRISVEEDRAFCEHTLGKSFDALMCIVFNYIHSVFHGSYHLTPLFQLDQQLVVAGCPAGSRSRNGKKALNQGCQCQRSNHNSRMAVQLYLELKKLFPNLLSVYSPSHVQFIYFYMLAIRPPLTSDFLDFLTSIFQNSDSLVLRRNSLSYIGSLLAHGSFITFTFVSSTLEVLSKWCMRYMKSKISEGVKTNSLWVYAPFHNACQVIFYLFTFRYREFVNCQNLKFSQSLNLIDLVSSPLNPLMHCNDEITKKFSAVAKHFEIAYCHRTLENNKRLMLPVNFEFELSANAAETTVSDPMFFPFERYLLSRSSSHIKNHYEVFSGFEDNIRFTEESVPALSSSFDDYLNLDHSLSCLANRSSDFGELLCL